MPFTLQTMILRYNYKSNDAFYSPNLQSLFNSFKLYVLMYSTAYNL